MANIRLEITDRELVQLWLFASENQNAAPEMQLLFKILNEKLDKILAHQLYTDSKLAATPEEREKARQAYLSQRGIV